jgi:hypothetical protein
MDRRLTVRPHTLLERTSELGLVRLADEVAPLMVERRIQEESVVLECEVLVGLADTALAEGHQLLALGERAHGDSPFLECDRHRRRVDGEVYRGCSSAHLRRPTAPCPETVAA